MKSRKNIFKLRLINTLIFIVLIFVQYNTVFSIKIFGINPMLPLSLLVCCCMFASELTSSLTGLIIGIFLDGMTSTPPGFNSILLFIMGLAVSLAVRHLFNNNMFSAVSLCAICTLIYLLLRWTFGIAFGATLTENLTYITQIIFPSVVYTSLFSIPFYYIEKSLYKKFYK